MSDWVKMPDASKNVSIEDASFFGRLIAFFIDYTLFKFLSLGPIIVLVIFGIFEPDILMEVFFLRTNIYDRPMYFTTLRNIVIHIILSVVFLGYFVVLESGLFGGKTLGKKILGYEVVNDRGKKLSFKESFLRNSTKYILRVPYIGIPFGMFEIILIAFYSKRTGDIIAKTSVAKEIHLGRFTKEQ